MSNLLAALGASCVIVAVYGLAGIWWAVLVTGLFLLASAYAFHTTTTAAGTQPTPAKSPFPPPRPIDLVGAAA